ncbi:MAG: flippase-like domain-containing protein [Sinobacteraceae bacterium]|nr:flippase-like domain-containing protein [Nevskiaceae bacterium]
MPLTARRRAAALFIVKLIFSVSLLTLLFWKLGSQAVLDLLRRASPGLLLLSVVALVGQTALSAVKWQLLLRRQGVTSLGYPQLLKIYLVGNFINLFMPSMLVGDAYRAARLRPHAEGWQGAVPSVLVDRATGLAMLLLIGALGLLYVYAREYLLPGALGLLAGAVLLYLLLLGPVAGWTARRNVTGSSRLARLLGQVAEALRPGPALLWVLLISCLFHFNTIVINWLYCQALGLPVRLELLLAIVPAVYLLEMVPLSINGIGVRESAFALLFRQVGLDPLSGVALGLTVSVMRYVAGLVGGAVMALEALRGERTA